MGDTARRRFGGLVALCALCWALLSGAVSAGAFEVDIPDPGLREKVAYALYGSSMDPTPIDSESLRLLTSLDARFDDPTRPPIRDLTGLEYATSLTNLDLESNEITDLAPIAGLKQLSTLKISQNKVSDLSPLAGLTALTELRADENEITTITALGDLKMLADLSLVRNEIRSVAPLAGLARLRNVDLRRNRIVDVRPLSGLLRITELRVNYNNLDMKKGGAAETALLTLYRRGAFLSVLPQARNYTSTRSVFVVRELYDGGYAIAKTASRRVGTRVRVRGWVEPQPDATGDTVMSWQLKQGTTWKTMYRRSFLLNPNASLVSAVRSSVVISSTFDETYTPRKRGKWRVVTAFRGGTVPAGAWGSVRYLPAANSVLYLTVY